MTEGTRLAYPSYLPATHNLYLIMEPFEVKYGGSTPMGFNESTLFKLNPLSKLKSYMVSKTGLEKTHYSLLELLTVLKDVIRAEGMLDASNPTVIICSQDLEEALNIRTLYVTEIRDLIWSHLTRNPAKNIGPAVITARNTTENAPVEQAASLALIEGTLHTSMAEDIGILDGVVEQTQVENIRDFMRCSIPNCGFCHTMGYPTPALCLPGMRQTGVITPVIPFGHHVPKNEGNTGTEPKRKRDIKASSHGTEVINLPDFDPLVSEAFLQPRTEPPLVFPQIGSGIIQNSKTKAWQDTKILFDQGSDECWISESYAKTMDCKPLGN